METWTKNIKWEGGAVLFRTTQEKDLGVTFSADLKVSEQCGIAASKGNRIHISDKGGLYIDDTTVGLSISHWLPCPLAI